jgi:hypothetical protein
MHAPRTVFRRARVFVIAAGLLASFNDRVVAQAWTPPAGTGSVSVSYQVIENVGHRQTDGTVIDQGKSTNMGAGLDIEYALTDRLTVSAGIPYVFAKYVGPNPPPPPAPYLPIDSCRCWHGGWQDFAFAARYNLVNGTFGLTPAVSMGVPSHDYDFRGEATLGSHLKELRLGADAGQRLDVISPKLSVQARYAYAVVERPLGIGHNRSNAAVEGDYTFTRRLAIRAIVSWQHTHGGLRFGSGPGAELVFPGEVNTPERLFQHDRLLRDNNWRLGAGGAYSRPRLELYASYIYYLTGTDSHAGRAITTGVSWPFEVSRTRTP